MNPIRVSKKPENMSEQEYIRAAIKEVQEKLKAKGETFAFDIAKRKPGKGVK